LKFTTDIPITRSGHQINVSDKLLLVGSCFAQEMGRWLLERRLDVHQNPNGILFHPSVIARCLRRAAMQEPYAEKEFVQYNNLYHSFDFHGSFSLENSVELESKVNAQLDRCFDSMNKASTLILTWGSAWGYKWKTTESWVSNCHKIPQENFMKELMTSDEIVAEYQSLLNVLWIINPGLKVIISVSPVRYWRDGAQGNLLSKSHLLIAANKLTDANAAVHYFPAYEIMMDELRDYRFYNPDMLHPSSQAVEFIIGKFQEMFFSEKSKQYVLKSEPVIRFLNHRPLHTDEIHWREICSLKEQELNQLLNLYS
jgi:hypothetical protein